MHLRMWSPTGERDSSWDSVVSKDAIPIRADSDDGQDAAVFGGSRNPRGIRHGILLPVCIFVACNFLLMSVRAQTYDFTNVNSLFNSDLGIYGGNVITVIEQGTRGEIYRFKAGTITTTTRRPVASASKWCSGAIILRLVEAGYFKLDDPIGRYLPGFNDRYSNGYRKGDITIRQCCAMTSGLFEGSASYSIDTTLTLAASVDLIASNVPVVFAPGTRFAYDGAGMQVVGRICEVVTGQDWRTLAQERLFDPLGMTQSDYLCFGANPSVPGGVRSTVEDYLRFLRMVMNNGVAADGRTILSGGSLEEFFTNKTANLPKYFTPWSSNAGYGMCSWIQAQNSDNGVVEEVSSPGTFGAWPWVDRKRNLRGLIFMCTASGFSDTRLNGLSILATIRAEIDRVGLPPLSPPLELTATAQSFDRINLAWKENFSNEDEFRIERSTDGTNFIQTAVVGANVATYADNTGLKASTKYYYRMRAHNSLGDSAYSSTATATTQAAPNRSPTTSDMTTTTVEDTARTVAMSASDADGDVLTYTIVNGPAHGSLGAVSGSNVVYAPAANFNGADSFTFRVNDGRTNSAPATVSITVTAVNDAPVCSITSPTNGTTFTAPASIAIQATASDVDGTVAKVEFYQSATKLGEDTTSPYAYTWTNVAAGSYTLTAKATDTNGAVTTSAGVNVTVNSAGGGSNVTVIATCDNAYELYVNGVLKGTGNNWQQSHTYSAIPLQPGRNVIAVKGIDQGGVAGFLAETIVNGVRSGSSANWKVSLTGPAGWTNAVFDDSTWVTATDYGAYGIGPWNKGVAGMPTNTPARWIWSSDANNHDTVYFRCVVDLPGGAQNQPPVALAGVDPINGTTLDEYYFWGTESYDPDGVVTSYQWIVNSEVVSTAAEFLYTFDSAGTYMVTLTVTDNKGATDSDLMQVQVTDPAVTVSVEVPDGMAGEPGLPEGNGTIRVRRTGAVTQALTVNVALSGDASNGVDYAAVASTVVISAGASYRDVTISPISDGSDESDELVVLTVLPGTGYAVDVNASAGLVPIKDQTYGIPVVSAEATDALAKEPMQTTDKGSIKVSRTGSCHTTLTAYCTLGGTAVNGVDYSAVTVPVVLAVGQSSKVLTIAPLADGVVDSNETVVLTLTTNAVYQIQSGKGTATVTIQDATVLTTPVVSVVATDADAQEPAGGVLNYGYIRFARTTRFHETLTVNCTVGGTASNGVDYVKVTVPTVFAVGEGIRDLSIRPIADDVVEDAETAVFTLTAGTGYSVDVGKASATVNIRD